MLKPGLLGGLAACKDWITLAGETGSGWWITSSLETNIGLNAIAQWTYTLQNPIYHGLSTGSLFINNIPSPLYLHGERLYFDPDRKWDLTTLGIGINPMNAWQKELMINGQLFTFKELLTFSSDKIVYCKYTSLGNRVYRFIINWLDDTDYIVQHSSGTTGKTKEIRLSKQSMIKSAANTCSYFNLQKGQKTLLCLPIAYIAGKMMVVRCIVGELNLQVIAPNSMPNI